MQVRSEQPHDLVRARGTQRKAFRRVALPALLLALHRVSTAAPSRKLVQPHSMGWANNPRQLIPGVSRNNRFSRLPFVYMRSSPADLEVAKAQGAVIVDIRTAGEREEGYVAPGSIHRIWDGSRLPLDGLPEDKSDPIIVY